MNTYTTRDGRILKWGGYNACVCTLCEELFNSVGAFEAHIKNGEHDYSWMPRNKAGRLVISLRDTSDFKEAEGE